MLKFLLFPLLLSPLQQADEIQTQRGNKPTPCFIVKMNYRKVYYKLVIQGAEGIEILPQTQEMDASDIKVITLNQDNKSSELVAGESRMSRGDYESAIKSLGRAVRNPRASGPSKQMAHIALVECHMARGDLESARGAIDAMKRAYPDSYYLFQTFEMSYRAYRQKGDERGMGRVLSEFRRKARESGRSGAGKSAELLQADLHEYRKNWRKALAIHQRYTRDRIEHVRESARLGELRCLSGLKQSSQLRTKAQAIIADAARGRASDRLLMGAYNARGEVHFQGGKTKEALLDFLKVAWVLGPRVGGASAEREQALGKAAIAAAKFGSEQTDAEMKSNYRSRAQALLGELKRTYGRSGFAKDVEKQIAAIK